MTSQVKKVSVNQRPQSQSSLEVTLFFTAHGMNNGQIG